MAEILMELEADDLRARFEMVLLAEDADRDAR